MEIRRLKETHTQKADDIAAPTIRPEVVEEKIDIPEEIIEEKPIVHQEVFIQEVSVKPEELEKSPAEVEETVVYHAEIPPKEPARPPKPGFFERNPDLEKFIGENLINKIGIAILVLGIGLFVKYAIDKQWITPIGRVFIGILAGGILLGLAHRMRKNYKAFSSVLIGGGMAIFYFTIAIAFRQYEILGQTEAFVIMILITLFTVILSILYDRLEIAALAIIGGFLTPFLVSQGDGNYVVLFSYLTILNLGMLILAYFKNWSLINLLCYVFTIIIFGAWLVNAAIYDELPVVGGLFFATLFYLIFFLMNIINHIKENRKFLGFHIGMLISNSFLYFWAGMTILGDFQEGMWRGLFTALIAVFNFAFAYTLYKSRKIDLNLNYLLIGLTLTFISLTAPIQLEGNYITLFWAVEAVLLLWLAQKSGIKLMKLGALLIMGLMIISLVMDWYQIYQYSDEKLATIFNKGFIASVVALLSFKITLKLLNKEGENFISGLETNVYRFFLQGIFILFLYISLLLELTHQINYYVDSMAFRSVIIGSYNLLFIIGCIIWAQRGRNIHLVSVVTMLGVFGMLVYMGYYHPHIIILRDSYLGSGNVTLSGFLYHYILTILMGVLIYLTISNIRSFYGFKTGIGKAFLWFICFVVLFLASAELDHLVVLNGWNEDYGSYPALVNSHKIGYPILWGISSFVLMLIGMKIKMKTLRIISLTVFFITLAKLFLFDIRGISEGGKIAAFICLSILLLVVSYMYQKLKKLIMEEEVKTPEA